MRCLSRSQGKVAARLKRISPWFVPPQVSLRGGVARSACIYVGFGRVWSGRDQRDPDSKCALGAFGTEPNRCAVVCEGWRSRALEAGSTLDGKNRDSTRGGPPMEAWFMPPHRFIGTHKSTLASGQKRQDFCAPGVYATIATSSILCSMRSGYSVTVSEGSCDILFPEDLPMNLRSSGRGVDQLDPAVARLDRVRVGELRFPAPMSRPVRQVFPPSIESARLSGVRPLSGVCQTNSGWPVGSDASGHVRPRPRRFWRHCALHSRSRQVKECRFLEVDSCLTAVR